MNLPKFLYYILTEDGRSAQVVNKTVTFVGAPTHLPQTPDGWQALLLAWERSMELHGLNGNFSLNLGYVLDGCRILSDTTYRFTTEAKLFLLVNQLKLILNPGKYKWFYKYFHKAEINLSECEDERDMFKAPLTAGGLEKLITANWDTVYRFPMNVPEAVNLIHDGVTLFEKGNFFLVYDFEIDNADFDGSSFAPLILLNQEGTKAGLIFFSQSLEHYQGATWDEIINSDNMFGIGSGQISGSLDAHITGKIVYTCTKQDAANGFNMTIVRSNQLFANQFDYALFEDNPLVEGRTYTHDIDIIVPVMANEKIHMTQTLGGFGGTTKIIFSKDSKISVDFEYRHPKSNIKCFTRDVAYRKLIKAVTGDENNASSDLCEQFKFLLITCGDAIRGFENPILETSLSDFFKDTDSILMAGMDILPTKVELEDRVKYYTVNEADEIDLGDVTDFTKKPAKDRKCNTFKFGATKQNIEDVNGKYDPNGTNLFTGPLTKDVKEYNQVSPYKCGPYEIESLRANLDGKTSTDNDSDKDIFVIVGKERQSVFTEATVSFVQALNMMICSLGIELFVGQQIRITGSISNDGVYDIVGINNGVFFQLVIFQQTVVDETDVIVTIEVLYGQVYELERPAYDTIEGVPTDSIFNIPYLTPKARLRRHKRWLAGINAGLLDKPIKFSSAKENKNTDLKTTIGSVVVDEDADEYVSDPLWLPWKFIFKTIVRVDLPELLEENPNRTVRFRDEHGNIFRGFIESAGIAVNEYTPQEFRLLATPNNDLTLLIHG